MRTQISFGALTLLAAGLLAGWAAPAAFAQDVPLDEGFRRPPDAARPWVYWFWLNGNITPEGITADLEAMRRVGIGGALIMEVDQGAPVGPVDFMGPQWRELFQHVHREANRLGLEINMNDDAGWNGSGGPWITPEQAMQEVTWSETETTGPARFEAQLAQPPAKAGYYRDIAVQAFPATDDYRIPGIETKAAFARRGNPKPAPERPTARSAVDPSSLVDLTAKIDAQGRLAWDVPEGRWTILRVGHTCTGAQNAPAPASGRGLECDKLSPAGIEANFAGMMAKLADDNGIAARPSACGLVATHIDSWENGSQNWTARMREEFRQRRGYELTPFLPVFTGRVVRSPEISERFLWDVRRTVSELVIENYAARFHELAGRAGMRFTVEAYGGPCDCIPYGGQSDEPMGEFWTPGGGAMDTCRGMASAGHVYGKPIIGAEAFTSADQERWLEHPALLKALGDQAFCEGINRFVFHRYAMQPWLDYRPGMTMGPWGQHYERTQTWWEQSRPWHEYLARCQFLLRQGLYAADILYVQPESPPLGFGRHPNEGYAWDECTDDAVLNRLAVRDGRLVLPDGMSYRLLALSDTRTMTPRLLRKLKELVEAGATVLGPRPQRSPSLSDYPQCDAEVDRLAGELWGECDGQQVKERAVGQGRIAWGLTPEKLLAADGLPPDFACPAPWRFLHRSTPEAELYFVANGKDYATTATCAFRVAGRVPELWWPEDGRIERAGVYASGEGLTRVSLTLGPSGSVFVVFRQKAEGDDPVVLVRRDGKPLLSAAMAPPPKIAVTRARYGVLDDPQRTRDVTAQVQARADARETTFRVSAMADDGDPALLVVKTLVVDYTVDGKPRTVQATDPELIHLGPDAVKVEVTKAVYGVLGDPARTRDVREKLQRVLDAGESSFPVARMAEGDDPAFGVVKTLVVDYTRDGQSLTLRGKDPDLIDFATGPAPPAAIAQVRCNGDGQPRLDVREPGDYELVTASGRTRRVSVPEVPAAADLPGPWSVRFAPGGGAPEQVMFEQLISWSEHPERGVKFYSGSAGYRTVFTWKAPANASDTRVLLDLGQVEVMAEVTLNGKDLGLVWKPPYQLDVTGAIQPGENRLEVNVVNLWPNRMIGDEQLPEDSQRNPNGTLQKWPDWVLAGRPSPTGRYTFTTWRLWKREDSLLPSGLLGPVRLVPVVSRTTP